MRAYRNGDTTNVETLLVCPKCESTNIRYIPPNEEKSRYRRPTNERIRKKHPFRSLIPEQTEYETVEITIVTGGYFICLDCGESFERPQEKEIVCKLGVCEFCGKYMPLDIHHMNMDRADNRPENLARICGYCHSRYHGLLNQLIPDKASQREAIYTLQQLGLSKKEIFEVLKQSAIKISQLKGD